MNKQLRLTFFFFLAVLIVPVLCQASVTILSNTSPNHTVISGSDEQICGSSSSNQITLEGNAKAELINFPGQNVIEILVTAHGFTVSRSGTIVTFQDGNGTLLKIPATTDPQTVQFADQGPLTLSIHNGQVMLDDQVVTTTAATIQGDKKILRVSSAFRTSMQGIGTTIKWVEDRIGLLSNGTITMDVSEPGGLSSYNEMLPRISAGDFEAGFGFVGYSENLIPAAVFFGAIPFGPEPNEYLAWMWEGNGMQLWQQLYDNEGYNVKVLVCGVITGESGGWFNREINTIHDFNGLRIRSLGMAAEVFEKIGAIPVSIGGSQVYDALLNGTIDAAEVSTPLVDEGMKFYEVAEYNYYPGWHQRSSLLELLINKDVWNSLTAHQQMVIEIICKAATMESIVYSESRLGDIIKENEQNRGVKNRYWSDDILAALKTVSQEVIAEKTAADPVFEAIWNDFSSFHQTYTVWSKLGLFPPRE
jgi:TRAP-type mannitol/chloroaromatic compound transport system substrate-binding protein